MEIAETRLPGVLLVQPPVFRDRRGYFLESWNERRFQDAGIEGRFVQDNVSFSTRGVLRGLHFQDPHPQSKLVSVLHGEVWDVVVDVRRGSPTFGRWEGHTLSAANALQLYVPPGFAHGFTVHSDTAVFAYKCGEYYRPDTEQTLLWNDPDLGIEWPVREPIVSDKDRAGVRFRDLFPVV